MAHLLVVIHYIEIKELDISDFVIESRLPRWQTIFKFNNIACRKSLTVTNHV